MLNKTIELADNMGYKGNVIFGNPGYYQKFGFKNAKEFNIQTSQGENFEPFMVDPIMKHTQPDGFLAVPPFGNGPGVLVLHAWWGLNDTIKAFCTRLAESGFVAFATDLYHGKVADTISEAEILGKALDSNYERAKSEIAAATILLSEYVGQSGQSLAVIGFSLGAYYALELTAADPEHVRKAVIFYGTGDGDFSRSKADYLGHFADNDPFEPTSNIDALEESLTRAGRPTTFYRYSNTGHWFFEPDRMDAFNPEAASLAWERTLAFLKRSSNF